MRAISTRQGNNAAVWLVRFPQWALLP